MKVLIIHASAGAGHTKAAEALYNGIRSHTRFGVALVDALDFTGPFYKKSYQNTYACLVKYAPWAWAFFFMGAGLPFLKGVIRTIRRCMNSIVSGKLERYLIHEKFDYILSTHFFSNEVAAALKRKGQIHSKIISVITDFDVHNIWLAEGIDHYAVASDYTKEKIESLGIKSSDVSVTGIPVHEKFTKYFNKKEIKQKLGLKDNMFTVLVATGSFGMGPIAEVINSLKEYQVVVVCGHNKNLYETLKETPSQNVKVFGLVDNMEELMAVSDCMVTKPGGLSIAEGLVSRLPLIFFSAIPGQETSNIKVLQKYGIARPQGDLKDLVAQVKHLNSSADLLNHAKNQTQLLAQPQAVSNVISLIHE